MKPATHTADATEDVYLTAAEVCQKIETCIGIKGGKLFRKWTEGRPPVLTRYYFRHNKRPYYKLSEVAAALKPSPKPN